MAAAVVGLSGVAGVLTILGPVITTLIQRAEVAFPAPKSGTSKLSWVLSGVKTLIDGPATPTVTSVPTDAELTAVIEATLAAAKQSGTLTPAQVSAAKVATPTPAGSAAKLVNTLQALISAGVVE